MPNLLNKDLPTYRIADRKLILERIYDTLFHMPECVFGLKSWREMTPEQQANWESRQLISNLMHKFGE